MKCILLALCLLSVNAYAGESVCPKEEILAIDNLEQQLMPVHCGLWGRRMENPRDVESV